MTVSARAQGTGVPQSAAPSADELTGLRRIAIQAAEAAGAVIREALSDDFTAAYKRENADIMTSLDLSSEASVVQAIHSVFPTHRVMTEEAGELYADGGPWTWLIDPLDGSNNVSIGFPVVAVGLAVCHARLPVVSVVHEPLVRRTSSAIRGLAAWEGPDRPLAPAARGGVRVRPLVAWSQGYGVGKDDRIAASLRDGLYGYAQRVLELWAPVAAWMMVARGDIDGIVGYRIGELDLHAGALIAAMNGVEIRELDGSRFDPGFASMSESRSLVAARPECLSELLEVTAPLAAAGGGRPRPRTGPLPR